ncbi:MAG: hypothetical protein QHJ81_07175 [Anaerolineae bacterium]|nr:hypothetical protein [Anaerolineae bacterium]
MERIGEIVATSSNSLTAVSFTLHQPPALGSLVKVEEGRRTVYGVVSFGTTTGLDPGRRVVRRSTEEVFDAAIYAEHPQLEKTLRTEFAALLVGYCGPDGRVHQHLPPQPPPLHYSVCTCEADEVVRFSQQRLYFRLLLAAVGELPPEQLLAAHIRETTSARGDDQEWLAAAAREVAALLKGDYDRLMSLLQTIEPER